MNVFHRHPDTEVHDEHRNSLVFLDYRVRDWGRVEQIVERSRAAAACFKIISDSHLLAEVAVRFPQARFIWPFRDYRDVANSRLRKFAQPTRAIRIVCRGESGGGWFQEGVSDDTARILRGVYTEALSEFDLACLTWWARNRIVVENDLGALSNLLLIRYEELVVDPRDSFTRLFAFVGLRPCDRALARVHSQSIARHSYPPIDGAVRELCDDLTRQLQARATAQQRRAA